MRRIFFLSLSMLICTAGICLAAARLWPAETSRSPAPDAETTLTVRIDGALTETTMADYLPGVVAAEMPASFEPEALRAQAVAARTYILDHAAHRVDRHKDADVCSDPGCCCAWVSDEAMRENWGRDYRKNLRKIRAAVAETDGETIVFGGEPIRAVFHSASAGRTEDSAALWGALPYLVSVDSPETAEDVPGFVTEVCVSADEMRAALDAESPGLALPEDPGTWLGEVKTDASGRVESLTLGGVTLSGAEARSLFSLRSTAFTVNWNGEAFVFTVSGSGHGVGMSQYGANVMAKNGSGYREILAHYYPGTELRGGGKMDSSRVES